MPGGAWCLIERASLRQGTRLMVAPTRPPKQLVASRRVCAWQTKAMTAAPLIGILTVVGLGTTRSKVISPLFKQHSYPRKRSYECYYPRRLRRLDL